MARTQTITKDMIFSAATELVAKHGFRAFTARRIADKVGCSTQPIYNVYKNMDELKEEILAFTEETLDKKVYHYKRTGKPYFDFCLGYIEYAHSNPIFFQLACSDPHNSYNFEQVIDTKDHLATEATKKDLGATATPEDAREVYYRLAVFSHGLADLFSTGSIRFDMSLAEKLLRLEFDDAVAGVAKRNAMKS